MLDTDRLMFVESVNTLRKKDTSELKIDIRKKDLMINEYEREVRKKVFTHLSICGTADIAVGLVLTSIIIDIERIGDYTKNITELTLNHPSRLKGGILEDELSKVEENLINIFDHLISAFKNSDIEMARETMINASEITKKLDQWVISLIKGKGTPENCADAICLGLYLRFLKRVCSHLRNIASSIVNPFHRIGYREKNKNKENRD
ncbi:PhoU domain-containing protein [candidate division KSB1 bacterium]